MKVSAIDIGTNSVLLLIMEGERVVCDIAEITRLGEGMKETGYILPRPARRTLKVLSRWKAVYLRDVQEVFVFATHPLREAKNAGRFIELIKRTLGFDVRVLSPSEEAFYSFLSVLEDREIGLEEFILLDIGGGSTEVVRGGKKGLEDMESLPFGCVNLTEMFISRMPATEEEILSLEAFLKGKTREELVRFHLGLPIVCVGGTGTTCASLIFGLEKFDSSLVHGKRILLSELQRLIHSLRPLQLAEIRAIKGMDQRRAEVLLAGALLLKELVSFLSQKEAIVSTRGARYGVLYQRIGRWRSA